MLKKITMTNWEKDTSVLPFVEIVPFNNVPNEIIYFLKKQIEIKNKLLTKANNDLAGHLQEEYYTNEIPTFFNNYILNCIANNNMLRDICNRKCFLSRSVTMKLNSIWINFQKKYEFNPVHDHSGIFSFIIFMQVPYKLENEDKIFENVQKKDSFTSRLSFLTLGPDGEIRENRCNVDQSYVHKMLIFDAKTKHMVYPFYTSNDYRITVSGNIVYNVD